MPEVNAKFIIAIAVAALVIGSGFTLFHESYNAKPYVEIKDPQIFENETKMLSFSKKGSSFSFTGNGTVRLYGTITTASGNPYSGPIFIYVFPRVDEVHVSDGYYSVILCHYGAYTVGYKASGYKTSFSTFSVLSGSGISENIRIHREGDLSVSGTTERIGNNIVSNVNLTFVSFFGTFRGTSNDKGIFSTNLQNGTYLVLTIKRNYNTTPKPEFINVTGSIVKNLVLLMNRSKNATFYASGKVNNDLGVPLGGVKITSIDVADGKIVGTTYSQSNGNYIINISGDDVLTYSLNGYIHAHSKELFVNGNIASLEQNLTVVNPFISQKSNSSGTGISHLSSFTYLPAFMDSGVSSYATSHNSIPLYRAYALKGNISLSLSNTFYTQGTPASTSLLNGFEVTVIAYLNGTYYHTTSRVSSSGQANISLKYGGNFNFVAYVPGFNWTSFNIATLNPPDHILSSVSLTPLPGQYFAVHYNVTSKGYALLYPNITMSENEILVNQSLEGSNVGTFMYFSDTHINYVFILNISVQEVGFQNKSLSIILNGESPYNLTENIVMKPVFSIGYKFNDSLKSIPGFSQNRVNSSMSTSFSSNYYNKGRGAVSFNLETLTNISGEHFILYTRIYGTTYSRIITVIGSSFEVNTNFTASFHFTLVGFYYTYNNISAKDLLTQHLYVSLSKRQAKNITLNIADEMAMKLNRNYGKDYNVSLQNSLSLNNLYLSDSSIQLQPQSNSSSTYANSYVYLIPHGIFIFTYRENGYIQNSTQININNTGLTHTLNITGYGVVLLIHNPLNLSARATVFPVKSYVYKNSTSKLGSNSSIVAYGVNMSLITAYTSFKVGNITVSSPKHTLTAQNPVLIQYVNISKSLYLVYLSQKPYSGTPPDELYELYNGSFSLSDANGFLTNISVLPYNSANTAPFYMSTGTQGYFNNINIFTLTHNTDKTNLSNNVEVLSNVSYAIQIKLGQVQNNLSGSGQYEMYLGMSNFNFKNQGGTE